VARGGRACQACLALVLRVSVVMVIVVVIVVDWGSEDIRVVREVGSVAGKDSGAGTNHILGEGELLAVENEEVSVFVKFVLVLSAFSAESLNSVLLV